MTKRSSGVLMHITSLPSDYGIGTFGKEAYRYADFLFDAKQAYWQILPINPTGYGDSPYQSFSTFAGNPYLIDLDILIEQGLLKKEEVSGINWGDNPLKVDFGKIYKNRFKVLKKAYNSYNFDNDRIYKVFCTNNSSWLDDFAVYMTIKNSNNGAPWYNWKNEKLKINDGTAVKKFSEEHIDEINFQKFLQYQFYLQWNALKRYVNDLGIKIIGDIPIYVSSDSADVWADKNLFLFDEDNKQSCYAGVPPDFFSEDGQFWGNPIYDWKRMKENGYKWWIKRISHSLELYDVIRLDHFRGLESYYSIDKGAKTAATGRWEKGPGQDFINTITNELGSVPMIAEDLGFITQEVRDLRDNAGYPGMKILQFAFDSDAENDFLPHNYTRNCVAYTGTHDNNTLGGWFKQTPKPQIKRAQEYVPLTRAEGNIWGMLRLLYSSVADLAIAQMQDFLELGSEARMNIPATVGGNWQWRINKNYDSVELINKIERLVKLYGRA